MATAVVYSTLVALLAKSHEDLWDLWNLNGSYNDPDGDKHSWPVTDVLQGGNFRSALVDSWAEEGFEEVSVLAVNMFGDIFWSTDFNVTGTSNSFSDWFVDTKVLESTAFGNGDEITASYPGIMNFVLRTGSHWWGHSYVWFAVTRGNYNVHRDMPRILVTTSADAPFALPAMMEGHQGCLPATTLSSTILQQISDNSPERCVAACVGYDAALLLRSDLCKCGHYTPGPSPQESRCTEPCPGDPTSTCGTQKDMTYGDLYHIPVGSDLPGSVLPEIVQSYVSHTSPFLIDVASVMQTANYLTRIHARASLNGQHAPHNNTYTFMYGIDDCTKPPTTIFNFPNATNITEPAHLPMSTDVPVDVLRVRCINLTVNAAVTFINVTLYSQNTVNMYAEASALLIQAKRTVLATSSRATTSLPAPTTTTTTTMATTATTPTPPPTTTPARTTSSSLSSTTTSSSSSTTTTTAASATSITVATTGTSKTTPRTTSTVTESAITTSSTGSSTPTSSIDVHLTTATNASTTVESSVSVAGTSTSSPDSTEPSPGLCVRRCVCTHQQANYNEDELLEKIVALQKSLRVDKKGLSSTRRRHTSASDTRPVAVGIGFLSVAVILVIFSVLIILDAERFWKSIKLVTQVSMDP